jgi:hypothetical protein
MKTVRNTSDLLVLRRRPWLLSILFLFIAGVMGYVGLLALVRGEGSDVLFVLPWFAIASVGYLLYCQTDTVTFDRSTGEMRHRRRLLLWGRTRVIPLDRVRRARIEQSGGERVSRDATFLRPVVDLSPPGSPPYRLVARTLTGPGSRQAADAINDWLRGQT